MDIDLAVRINNYRGLPKGAPESSKYFVREPHGYNKDQYSISFRFTPRAPGSKGGKGGSATAKEDRNGADGAKGGDRAGKENGTDGTANNSSNGTDDGTGQVEGISAADLQFGNDFDHSIRNFLPPGVNTAMNILKWWIDPGLEGDAYADEPFLYGPALSSFNAVRVGAGEHDEEIGLWVEEGASSDDEDDDGDDDDDDGDGDDDTSGPSAGSKSGEAAQDKNENSKAGYDKGNNNAPTSKSKSTRTSGKQWRENVLAGSGVGNDPKRRQKWALKEDAKKKWAWEYGRTYAVDFYNPYIDFGKCELKLPGFGVNVLRYWDGETGLRYVLRNRLTQKPYLVILFTLYPNDMVNKDGTLKPEALKAIAKASGGRVSELKDVGNGGADGTSKMGGKGGFKEDKALEEAKEKLEGVALGDGPKRGAGGTGTTDDDID